MITYIPFAICSALVLLYLTDKRDRPFIRPIAFAIVIYGIFLAYTELP